VNKPNILFILTDDQGWSQLSGEMYPGIAESRSTYLETPYMDSLAAEGMRFCSGYSPAPLCTPTRRSILCGTSAARSGPEFPSEFVPADHLTMPRALKQADPTYRCAHFGKWGMHMGSSPEACGYDESDGETNNFTGGMENKEEPHHIVDDPKRTFSLTRRAQQFMYEQVKQRNPFYLQVSYYAVHLRVETVDSSLNYFVKKGEPDRGYTAGFAGMLRDLDDNIGELLETLEELGITQNTYVVFMSDNGGRPVIPGGDTERLPTNYPLSGSKQKLLEGGVRVPFIIRGPGIEAKTHTHIPVCGYDLLPTFYELAGGTEALPDEVDGGSFTGVFEDPRGATVSRSAEGLIFHRPNIQRSVYRQGDLKLYVHLDEDGRFVKRQLFNVREDPSEQIDLAMDQPEIVTEFEGKLTEFLERVR
jgi:arylsulfatase A-like enzyme